MFVCIHVYRNIYIYICIYIYVHIRASWQRLYLDRNHAVAKMYSETSGRKGGLLGYIRRKLESARNACRKLKSF